MRKCIVMRLIRLSDVLHPRNGLATLRWILPPVIGLDTVMTLLGQPDSYWSVAGAADEYNDFFAWFLMRGPAFFLATSLLYIAGAVLAASILPRRVALIALYGYVARRPDRARSAGCLLRTGAAMAFLAKAVRTC